MEMEATVTEAVNLEWENLDELSSLELVRRMNEEDGGVAAAVKRELPAVAQAVDLIVASLQDGGRLIYVGCGTSGRLGVLDASECPVTFGVSPGTVVGVLAGGPDAMFRSLESVEDNPEQGVADLTQIQISRKDVVVGLSASGSTPYVLGAMEFALKTGCRTVGVSCNPDSPLGHLCTIAITPVVGPEVVAGSTRLKAGTAQKLVLNMLSTGAMVKLGRCYRNLMIDFNGAACAKLKRRAVKILMELTKCDADAALQALTRANFAVKPAIVMCSKGISYDSATELLKHCNQSLPKALESG